MNKLIQNDWSRESGESFDRAQILDHEIHPEGLDVERLRFTEAGPLEIKSDLGHIVSILRGKGKLQQKDNNEQTFHLEAGVHLYIPPGLKSTLDMEPGTELVHVSCPSASQVSGKRFILRDETFLAACTSVSQPLRWILTPQYLSRRIFLHHDKTLLSRSGHPVSWFHTTMFDVAGLPENEDGEPVFKMSYNSRTEVNFCYDVKGKARVRMAEHPYQDIDQLWEEWLPIDNDSTYHVNEAASGPEEEGRIHEATQISKNLRNKHEVSILEGYVSLFCLFDPAPTGVEQHQPGEYSDYEPLQQVLGTDSYKIFAREITGFDEMVDQLSVAKALGKLDTLHDTPLWELYLKGQEAQAANENEMIKALTAEGNGREKVLVQWVQPVTD